MNRTSFFVVLAMVAGGIGGFFCQIKKDKQEHAFYNGEILAPDYVHTDTLVVVNADLLNSAIPHVTTDGEISAILSIACDIK